jgi:hypothetical protein
MDTDTFNHGLSHLLKGSRGGCKCLDRHKNCVHEVSSRFQSELNALGVFSVSMNNTLND